MRTFTLNTWDRMTLVAVISNQRGPWPLLRNYGKMLDVIELSEEEKAEVGLIAGDGLLPRWQVNIEYDLELEDDLFEMLQQAVDNYEGWTVGSIEQVGQLRVKLELEG